MKKLLFAFLLFAPALSWAEAGQNPDDYKVLVHVQSSRLLFENREWSQLIHVVIDGKKYRLEADSSFSLSLLRVGDYRAKIIKDDTSHAYEYRRDYEFLFPDGKTRKYTVVGETE